jgi:hypothetical protein
MSTEALGRNRHAEQFGGAGVNQQAASVEGSEALPAQGVDEH